MFVSVQHKAQCWGFFAWGEGGGSVLLMEYQTEVVYVNLD